MKSAHIKIPENILAVMDELVKCGLYKNRTDIILDALKKYHPIEYVLDKANQEVLTKVSEVFKSPKIIRG